ncbi:LysR family transcriptional regulator [Streptomyces sp. NPDC035033]|uniref:LysR family transcriptional regulator n=1 Tax=Streptomyces sp. NPDC035033 TaxID=3155368 RepID=UPI0033D35BCF
MQLQQLRTFREVAAELSFTRAARNLHYSQPSVTAHIKNLEEFIGTPLFHRGGGRIELTDAGRSLLPHAERIIEIAETAEAECREAALAGRPRTAATSAA